MEIIEEGTITTVPGFCATGVSCGLKKGEALDLALIVSDVPCNAAATTTTNKVAAAPVIYDRQLLARYNTVARAVVINAGCANACTGERGLHDAEETARIAGQALGVPKEAIWVMSTGVIGVPLPMEKIASGIKDAVPRLSPWGGHSAAQAIMTTDTRPKEFAIRVGIKGKPCTIGGICKGAGMIHPNMATMLCVIATDARVSPNALQAALKVAVDRSFNMMTVDGDTSTNDTVLLLANGLAGNAELTQGDRDFEVFVQGLTLVTCELAKMIAADGEGATKFIEINVKGALSFADAKTVAMAIAHSPLVKTAIYGQDANWGRVLAAAGYSGAEIDPTKLALWFDDLQLVRNGEPYNVNEHRAKEILGKGQISITLHLGLGDAEATVWTCDLTHDYISINAHYRT